MQSLAYDVARCSGYFPAPNKLHPECQACLRRTPGRPEYQSYIQAPPFKETCFYRIKPE